MNTSTAIPTTPRQLTPATAPKECSHRALWFRCYSQFQLIPSQFQFLHCSAPEARGRRPSRARLGPGVWYVQIWCLHLHRKTLDWMEMFKGARKEGWSLGDKRDPARVTSRARMEVEIRGDNPGRIVRMLMGWWAFAWDGRRSGFEWLEWLGA